MVCSFPILLGILVVSQLVRYSRSISDYLDFVIKREVQYQLQDQQSMDFLFQDYIMHLKFYGRHQDLIEKYYKSMSAIAKDILSVDGFIYCNKIYIGGWFHLCLYILKYFTICMYFTCILQYQASGRCYQWGKRCLGHSKLKVCFAYQAGRYS